MANFPQNPLKRSIRSCRRQCEFEHVTKKRKEVDRFALLPDDILLEILKKLPPDLLRYKVKFVCRRWFILIINRILLDHASLIIQRPSLTVRLMDIREEKQGLKMKEQCIKIPYDGCIKSWCNEYLLITARHRVKYLYIFNLITKVAIILPPCSTSCGGHYGVKCGVSLSYDEFKGVYKIVHVFMGPPIQCELLLLNDKTGHFLEWKKVNGPSYMGQRLCSWEDPVSVQGRYLHWDVHCSKYLVSMDTVKERFRQTCLPGSDVCPMNNRYSLVEMGGCLTLLQKISLNQVNVWMLKDFQRTKWEKFQSICILSDALRIYPASVVSFPVTSVKGKRYIIFGKPGSKTGLYSYDLKNIIMKRLEIDIADNERCVVQSTAAGSFW